jgi:spiro-SPASM protein
MKNLAIINAVGLSRYAFEPIVEGASSFDRSLSFAASLPDCAAIVALAGNDENSIPRSASLARFPGARTLERPSWTVVDLVEALDRESAGFDDVFYFWGDWPLLDPDLTSRMHANHRSYFAEYSFADAYPVGLSPEILKASVLEALKPLAARVDQELTRDAIFRVIQVDINSFDIETEVSPVDVRLDRVSLQCDTKRNFLLAGRFAEEGVRDAASALSLIAEKPGLLRTLPAFLNLQVAGGCPQACSYCPYPKTHANLLSDRSETDLDLIVPLLDRAVDFCGDAVVSLSLWGESSLHSKIVDIAGAVLGRPNLRLLVETSGMGWSDETLDAIASFAGERPLSRLGPSSAPGMPGPVTFILSLDAMEEPLYRELRGPGFEEARAFADRASARFPGSVYVQAVRMKENEDPLEGFYRYWKEKTDRIIIQKYDHFSGFLPERKVTDLSPLVRRPCWHLMREICVLLDGTVPVCREDLGNTTVLGNAFTDPLEAIWKNGEPLYLDHVARRYPGPCAGCDEYYTFSF